MEICYQDQAFHHYDMKDVTYDAMSNRQVDKVQDTTLYIFQYHRPLLWLAFYQLVSKLSFTKIQIFKFRIM